MTYQPSEEKIAAVLAEFTPREITIAYLRAKRKAAIIEDMNAGFEAFKKSMKAHNYEDAEASVKKTARIIRTTQQVNE